MITSHFFENVEFKIGDVAFQATGRVIFNGAKVEDLIIYRMFDSFKSRIKIDDGELDSLRQELLKKFGGK